MENKRLKYSKFIKYYCEECKKEILYRSARNGAKRCRECYLKNPDKEYSHNFTKKELKKRAKQMSKNRKSGLVSTWNKDKSLWKERPELVLQMKKSLKGKHCNLEAEWKKGHKAFFKGKNSRKNQISRHHIDLNQNNNHPDNLLFLLNSSHNSLHKRAYDYLVRTNQIQAYINWFIIIFKPKIYKGYKNAK